MPDEVVLLFVVAVLIGVPAYAFSARGRLYATFSAVILAMSMPGIVIATARFQTWLPEAWIPSSRLLVLYSLAAAGLHMGHLVRARMRSRAFRWLVSIPGQVTVASGFMMSVWLVGQLPLRGLFWILDFDAGVEVLRFLDVVPFVIAIYSIRTSSRPLEEVVRIRMESSGPESFTRVPVERYRRGASLPALDARPLRIVQITDPHLGPWQTVESLRLHIESLLLHDPDLVLLTGDFLTMESTGTPSALREALAPLRAFEGKCFAILGNHDHDEGALEIVRHAMEVTGVRLLIDEEHIAETPIGPVQIVGANFVGRERVAHIAGLLEQFPRRDSMLRLFLLHDPLGFRSLAPGAVDLTLSGHTHGGQVGLVSLGFDWTVLSRSQWPDQGLFGLGSSRLYVHRGTGFYGFPLRVGVPGEASLLEVVL